jgi:hypothetical protein
VTPGRSHRQAIRRSSTVVGRARPRAPAETGPSQLARCGFRGDQVETDHGNRRLPASARRRQGRHREAISSFPRLPIGAASAPPRPRLV